LLEDSRHGALGVALPESGHPFVSRVAVAQAPDGGLVTLVSELALHTAAMRSDPRASLLLGVPRPRGDPLAQPRLTLQVLAKFVSRDDPEHPALRKRWLRSHPKARLYVDFADFSFVRLEVNSASLNAGFGKAYMMTQADLSPC